MKKNILVVVITAIIFTGIGVYATIQYQANEIGYGTGTVKDALDDLYDELDVLNSKFSVLKFPIATETYSNTYNTRAIGSFNFNSYLNKYQYITLKSTNLNSNCSTFDYQLFKSNWSSSIVPQINVKYSLSEYSIFYYYALANNTTNSCNAVANIELSN